MSRRPEARNSSCAPNRAGAWASTVTTSKPTMSARRDARLGREHLSHVQRAEPEDRLQVALGVELQAVLVHRAVQVDRELGDPQDPSGRDQRGGAVGQGETARPGAAPDPARSSAAARRRSRRPPARAPRAPSSRVRLELQAGGVGVGADDAPRRAGVDPSGVDQAMSEPSRITKRSPVTSAAAPGGGLGQLGEAGVLEPARGLAHRMEARGGGGDELTEVQGGGAGTGRGGGGGVT